MDRLTITQCIKIIKTYYKNGSSAIATYIVLKEDYGLHNRPTTPAIGQIVKKFEEAKVIRKIKRPVHHRFARSAENIDILSESVVRTFLRHIMAYFASRFTTTSILSLAHATTDAS